MVKSDHTVWVSFQRPAYTSKALVMATSLPRSTVVVILERGEGDDLIGGSEVWYRVVSSAGGTPWVAVGAFVDGLLESLDGERNREGEGET
jgi:hypothetical protein